jgi:predicted ATPase/DNA-binding CsgD family transcriptional regulator
MSTRAPANPLLYDRIAGLPAPVTTLVGRELEVAELAALLCRPEVRLVTLTGPGGVGKTRLAQQVAIAVVADFVDAGAFVSLGAIPDPSLVGAAIAQTLELQAAGAQPPIGAVLDTLRTREALLVLDNFEHLPTAAATVADLLAACPRLTILVTSRARLRLAGEHETPVAPLPVPKPDTRASPDLLAVPAVRLFADRARAANPAFALTDENAATVAAICRRLDGLPLAIELAAARCNVLSPASLLSRLERRLHLLTSGPRDHPTRLQTLRDAIAWSHDLLPPDLQALFARLSVFAGGFIVDAAEAVASRAVEQSSSRAETASNSSTPRLLDSSTVLEGIESLVEQSLLVPGVNALGEPRFAMLETIREFAAERLAASGDEGTVRDAHAACFLALAERGGPELRGASAQEFAWWQRLAGEIANFRAAIAWLRDRARPAEALRLVVGLDWFWTEYTYVAEGRAVVEALLAESPRDVPPATRAAALTLLGTLADLVEDHTAARAALEEALGLWQSLGETNRAAETLYSLATAAIVADDLPRAGRLAAETVAIAEGGGNDWFAAAGTAAGALVAALSGDPAAAIDGYRTATERFRRIGNPNRAVGCVCGEGFAALLAGELSQAREAYEAALLLELENSQDLLHVPHALAGLAAVAAAAGEPRAAAELFGAAAAERERVGLPLWQAMQAIYDRAADGVRDQLGEPVFLTLWTKGRGLTPDSAAAVARGLVLPSVAAGDVALSPRERDVLRLIVEGRSDREIADALFISRRTASQHVSAILGKLGVASRTAAATYATRHGLV